MFIRPTKRTCHSKLQTSPEFGQQFVFRQSDVVGRRETTRNMRVQNCRGIAASCDESLLFSPNNIDKFVDPTHGETCWETALGDLPITLFFQGKIPICWQRTFDRGRAYFYPDYSSKYLLIDGGQK